MEGDSDLLREWRKLGLDLKILRLFRHPIINRYVRIDSEVYEALELEAMNRKYIMNFSKMPVLSFPPEDVIGRGDIKVGRVWIGSGVRGPEFRLSLEELNQHMLVVGRSGCGKTTLLKHIMVQLIDRGIPFIAFDFKRDFRDLVFADDRVVIFRRGYLKINPLVPPPNIGLDVWERVFCDIYAFNYGWLHGSRNMLQEYLHKLYRRMGYRATLYDLYDLIRLDAERVVGRRRDYRDVVLNRLFSTIVNLSDYLGRDRWIEISDLMNSFVIIEMDGVSRDEQNFLIEFFLSWIYYFRLASNEYGGLRHILIFDEAKRIFDATKEIRHTTVQRGVAMFNLIVDEIRGLGEGLIVADQEPVKLTHSIKANTYVKVVGPLGHGDDIEDMARAINLGEEESKAIGYLDRGYWIVKMSGRYTEPFVIKTEPPAFLNSMKLSDALLDYHMRDRLDAFVERPFADTSMENRFLIDIYTHIVSTVRERVDRLGLSMRKYQMLKNRLLRKALIDEIRVRLRGRVRKIVVLTPKGMSIVKDLLGLPDSIRFVGHVSSKHMFYAECFRRVFSRLGYRVHLEAGVEYGRVDLYMIKDRYRLGIEIYTKKSRPKIDELNNIDTRLNILYILVEEFREPARYTKLENGSVLIYCDLELFLNRYLDLINFHSIYVEVV